MSRIDACFAGLKAEGRSAFVSFTMAGDPDFETCMAANLAAARLTNPEVRFVGMAADTSRLEPAAARAYLNETEQTLGLPAVDPVRDGVGRIVDQL